MTEEEKAAAEKAAQEAADKKAAQELEALKKQIDEANQKAAEEAESRKALEAKLKEIEKEKLDENERRILEAIEKEAEKHAPINERVEKLEASLKQMLDAELAEISEEKRALFPLVGTVEEQLDALRKAKKGGLFGPVKQSSSTGIIPGDTPKGDDKAKGADTDLAKKDSAKFFEALGAEFGIKFKRV